VAYRVYSEAVLARKPFVCCETRTGKCTHARPGRPEWVDGIRTLPDSKRAGEEAALCGRQAYFDTNDHLKTVVAGGKGICRACMRILRCELGMMPKKPPPP
jgi:hypothetical protein